jgi:hypothetical protein
MLISNTYDGVNKDKKGAQQNPPPSLPGVGVGTIPPIDDEHLQISATNINITACRIMSLSTPTSSAPKSIFTLDALLDNPVFAGGIGLAGLGAAAVFARKQAVKGAGLIKRRLLVDVEISKVDESYPYSVLVGIPVA